MAIVRLDNISKRFGAAEAVSGFSLEAGERELLVLLGPSGCGKSTVLRMIAGLEEPDQGTVSIAGRVVNRVPPKDRGVAMVFQSYALYPHMTVRGNLAFGLKNQGVAGAEIERRVREAAEALELLELLGRRPAELSGGQRQRVAMGRAMVKTPGVFLFDEPLSNLDARLRGSMRVVIKELHERLKTTTVYVTHDQVEAMTLADRVALMRDGRLVQVGTPRELFARPRSVFVASFIGSPPMNLLNMEVEEGSLKAGGLVLPLGGDGPRPAGPVIAGLRPSDIRLADPADGLPESWKHEAEVLVEEFLGTESLLHLRVHGQPLTALVPAALVPVGLAARGRVRVALRLDRLHVFDASTGEAVRQPQP